MSPLAVVTLHLNRLIFLFQNVMSPPNFKTALNGIRTPAGVSIIDIIYQFHVLYAFGQWFFYYRRFYSGAITLRFITFLGWCYYAAIDTYIIVYVST